MALFVARRDDADRRQWTVVGLPTRERIGLLRPRSHYTARQEEPLVQYDSELEQI